jgi:hypothetical protein
MTLKSTNSTSWSSCLETYHDNMPVRLDTAEFKGLLVAADNKTPAKPCCYPLDLRR